MEVQESGEGSRRNKLLVINNSQGWEMYSMLAIVNNTVMYLKGAKTVNLKYFHHKKIWYQLRWMLVLGNHFYLLVNHYVVYTLNLHNVNYISVKLGECFSEE